MNIREDGRVEWVCEHGVGHTIAIPYHLVSYIVEKAGKENRIEEQKTYFSHTCDGCCYKK